MDGKLADFAPAGLGVPGEAALPVYLLERGEQAQDEQEPAEVSSSAESSGDESDDLRKEERRQEQREERWAQREWARERAEHERQKREAPAQRACEAAQWDAVHGAEREAAWASHPMRDAARMLTQQHRHRSRKRKLCKMSRSCLYDTCNRPAVGMS